MTGNIKVFLIVLFFSCAIAVELDPNYSYDDFMKQFNRNYQGWEKALHEKIFKEQYAELLKLKAQGHDVVVNDFLDWTQDQRKAFFGYDTSSLNMKVSQRPLQANQLSASPSKFDWRLYDRVTPVKNQMGCGACWAFAATAQYESLLSIVTNGTYYDLSEQYPFQCDTNSKGCSGGNTNSALTVVQNGIGFPLETRSDYDGGYSTYPDICTNTTTSRLKINQTHQIYYFDSISVEDLQSDLVNYGPISVGVMAWTPFNSVGPSGLISCTDRITGTNHVVLLVGYNQTHWFIKNSWGETWGDYGYGYINKTADCNIRTSVNQIRINFDFPPIPPLPPVEPGKMRLSITMTDYNGWGFYSTMIGIKQNDALVGEFGWRNFTGYSGSPVYITIKDNLQTTIYVSYLGPGTIQIGFSIKAPNGTIIYQRIAGTTFGAGTIFKTFCPTVCPPPQTVTYQLTMTDSYGQACLLTSASGEA